MGRGAGRSEASSVSACSHASRSASRGRAVAPGFQRDAAAAGGARHRTEQRRANRGARRPSSGFGQSPQNQAVFMHQAAMWMQPSLPSQMPHPQWPQLAPMWPRQFAAGSFPAPPGAEEEKNGGRERDEGKQTKRQQDAKLKQKSCETDSSDDKSDSDKKKNKVKKSKKEKKNAKKDKKEKKIKKNMPMACDEGENEQPNRLVSHLEPSDSEPAASECPGSDPSGQGDPPDSAKAEQVEATDKATRQPQSATVGGEVPADAELPSDRLRQALSLLKDRREELEQVHAQLDQANADIDEYEETLESTEAELARERDANKTLVARSLEDRAELNQLRSDCDDAKSQLSEKQADLDRVRAELDQMRREKMNIADELAKLQAQLSSTQGSLSKAQESARVSQSQLEASRLEFAESRKNKAQLAADLESTRSKLTTATADLAELQKRKDGNATMMHTKLKMARYDLEKTRKELSVASTDIYNSRRKHAALTEQLKQAQKLAVSHEARKGLNAAWESLLSSLEAQLGPDELEAGFHQLGTALRAAGFWGAAEAAAEVVPETAVEKADPAPNLATNGGEDVETSPCSPPASPSAPDHLLSRLRSDADLRKKTRQRPPEDPARQKLEKPGKHRRREKKEKKAKSPREKRSVQEPVDGVLEEMPHRTCSVGQPALRRRRVGSDIAGADAAVKKSVSLSFADHERLATTILVDEYKHGALKEKLWVSNPLRNVLCEKCERRVPQQQGRLHGNPGASQFMQEKFYCAECVD